MSFFFLMFVKSEIFLKDFFFFLRTSFFNRDPFWVDFFLRRSLKKKILSRWGWIGPRRVSITKHDGSRCVSAGQSTKIRGKWDKMATFVVPSESLLRHCYSEHDGSLRCGKDELWESDASEYSRRRECWECTEDDLRTDDAVARILFALVEESGTRQRVRSLETAGGALRLSQCESTASHVAIHHASKDIPIRLWRIRGDLERMGTPRAALWSLGKRHSEWCSQASDSPSYDSRRYPSSADIGGGTRATRLCARRSCHTLSSHETGMRQSIHRTPLQHQWRWTHWQRRDAKPKEVPRAQGRKALTRHRGGQTTTKLARLATCAARRDTTRGIAEGSSKGKTKDKGCGKGNDKLNSVCEERREGDPHVDSTAKSAVTQDDHWIMMLEREAPQADLSKETGFEMCAVTLRTTSGQTMKSYGRCDIQMKVPPIITPAKVTFEVVDVR